MAKQSMLVLINPEERGNIDVVAEKIKEAGGEISNVMRVTGVISVIAEDDNAEAIRSIEGVTELRRDESIQLPPMDEDIPQ